MGDAPHLVGCVDHRIEGSSVVPYLRRLLTGPEVDTARQFPHHQQIHPLQSLGAQRRSAQQGRVETDWSQVGV